VVALFDESIDIGSMFTDISVDVVIGDRVESNKTGNYLRKFESEAMENFCLILKRSGVTLLVCQKLIHPYIQSRLKLLGLSYLQANTDLYPLLLSISSNSSAFCALLLIFSACRFDFSQHFKASLEGEC
jgi:hypothetical protein